MYNKKLKLFTTLYIYNMVVTQIIDVCQEPYVYDKMS